MREILFRGKRIDNGEWVEGYFVNLWLMHYQKYQPIITDNNAVSYDVDPSTVGQYTGLTDKNGKRIFEGDIVRCGTGRICAIYYFVTPSESCFDLMPISGFDALPPIKWKLFSDTEVIGNVYDNPELLEGTK